MSDVYSMSISADYRKQNGDHEIEFNYWDSNDVEGHACASSDNFDDCATAAFQELVEDILSTKEEDEYADYAGDLQEKIEDMEDYIASLESYVAELEDEVDTLLDENERLEHRCFETSKPVTKQNEYSKYDKNLEYKYDTKTIFELNKFLKGFGL